MRIIFILVLTCTSMMIHAEHLSGQDVYEQHCMLCHEDGVAGAPKFKNDSDWKPRLTQKSRDELVASAMKGLNAMPEKGTCTECDEAEIKAAIEYMVPEHE